MDDQQYQEELRWMERAKKAGVKVADYFDDKERFSWTSFVLDIQAEEARLKLKETQITGSGGQDEE